MTQSTSRLQFRQLNFEKKYLHVFHGMENFEILDKRFSNSILDIKIELKISRMVSWFLEINFSVIINKKL